MTSAGLSAAGAPAAHSAARRRGGPAGAGFGRLLLAEWTKIRSVRSTFWSLLLLVAITLGFTALLASVTVHSWGQTPPDRRVRVVSDPVSFILGAGLGLGQLTICVLGVLVITGEYSSGTIRASLLAVPRRVPMLAAKGMVFAALVFTVGVAVSFGSFFVGSPILGSRVAVSISDPGVARAVLGAAMYLTVLGLFAMAIGALIRHTAGAISGVIGFVLVLAPLAQLLPGSWGTHIHDYLPSEAGLMITQAHQQAGQVLTPWQGFGVFCAWTALLLAVACYLLQRRDA